MSWATEGRKINPNDGTVLADTGDLGESGVLNATCLVSCSSDATVILQRRNANNTTTMAEQYIDVGAHSSKILKFENLFFDTNERVRVVTSGELSGNTQVSLFY